MAKVISVDDYMNALDHPLKAELQVLREAILNVDPRITEQVKWNAPSFSYNGYMATFSLHRTEHLLLIFHNGAILDDQDGLLQGDYPDRRMVYFTDMADVTAKKPALERAIREWIERMDDQP